MHELVRFTTDLIMDNRKIDSYSGDIIVGLM